MEELTHTSANPESRPTVRAFPWPSLERIARAEVAALRDVHRWAAASTRPEDWASAAADLLGVPVSIRVDRAGPPVPFAAAGAVGVELARASASAGAGRDTVRVEAEPALAAVVLARALGRRAPRAIDPGSTAPSSLAGAFAAVLAAMLRRASRGEAILVRDAGLASSLPDAPGAASDGDTDARRVAASLTVTVHGEIFAARILVAPDALRAAPDPWSLRALSALGPTPLSIPIVACVAAAARVEMEALLPGDVFLPSPWPLAVGPGGRWRGSVTLAAGQSDAGVRALFGDDGRLVLSGEIEPLLAAEADMSDGNETAAILSAVGDVPVVVRVEVGEARMTAREWASLRPGDVVTLGRRVGEQVVLRVGGVPVARGQLVDVDGEVGVRIEERVVEGTTA
jgi:flagellar motor switch/type III secretory pathway protein FliN